MIGFFEKRIPVYDDNNNDRSLNEVTKEIDENNTNSNNQFFSLNIEKIEKVIVENEIIKININ